MIKPDAKPPPEVFGSEPVAVELVWKTDALVEAWFLETFHNVSQLSTEHFNKFRAAADRLKALLRQKES